MAMTDPIADMLTRIRNANSVYHEKVEIPGSKKFSSRKVLSEISLLRRTTNRAF